MMTTNISVVFLVMVLVCGQLHCSASTTASEFDSEISLGDASLAGHDTRQAREHYTAAAKLCAGALECSKAYVKRAAVWSELNKFERAADDLTQAIEALDGQESSARYAEARLSRATARLQLGLFDEAQQDLAAAERAGNALSSANKQLLRKHRAAATAQQGRAAKIDAELALRERGQAGTLDVQALLAGYVDPLLQAAPYARRYLLARMQLCRHAGGLMQRVADDAAVLIKMNANDADAYCWRGTALFHTGDPVSAKRFLKEGMNLDPDQRLCKETWKAVKTFAAVYDALAKDYARGNCAEALPRVDELLRLADGMPVYLPAAKEKQCVCLAKIEQQRTAAAEKICNEAVRLAGEAAGVELYLARAEVRLAVAEFAGARSDFTRAQQLDPHNARAADGLRRTQAQEKQAKTKDYYKILDVPRDATAKQIKKAYHALVQVWHPDKFLNAPDEQRLDAERKFRDIKDAYEVLKDDNKRALFDRGEDPNDPHRGQHGHGFPGGGFPFGGGHQQAGGFNFGGFPGGGFPGGFTFTFNGRPGGR